MYLTVSGGGDVAQLRRRGDIQQELVSKRTMRWCEGGKGEGDYLDIFGYFLVENYFHLAGIGALGVADLTAGRR